MTPRFSTCGEGRLINTYSKLLSLDAPRVLEDVRKDVPLNGQLHLADSIQVAVSIEPLSIEEVESSKRETNIFQGNATPAMPSFVESNDESTASLTPMALFLKIFATAGDQSTSSTCANQDDVVEIGDQLEKRFRNVRPLRLFTPRRQTYQTGGMTIGQIAVLPSKIPSKFFKSPEEQYDYFQDHTGFTGDRADWAGVQDDSSTMKLSLDFYPLAQGQVPRLEFHIKMTWVANGKKHEIHSMFGFHADNIADLFPARPVTTRADLRGNFYDSEEDFVKQYLTQPIPVGMVKHPKEATEFGIQYHGGKLYARNLDERVDFGPFTGQIRELKCRLEQGCKIFFVVPTVTYRKTCDEILESIRKVKGQSIDPYKKWQHNEPAKNTDVFQKVPLAHRPKLAKPAHLNYLNLQEYTVIETYGFIREFELAETRKLYHTKCRLVHVAGARGRELIALIQQDFEKYDLEFGDLVSASIPELLSQDIDGLSWAGRVMGPLKCLQSYHIVIHLYRPHDATTGEYLGRDATGLNGVSTYSRFEDESIALNIIKNTASFEVDISATADLEQTQRRIETIRNLHKTIAWEKKITGFSLTEDLILANTFDRLPTLDLFEGAEEFVDFARNRLHPDQLDAFDSLRQQVGGLSLVVGPPGSGKTELLCLAVITHLRSTLYEHPQALVVSPVNGSVDELTRKLVQLTQDSTLTSDNAMVVVRLQAAHTERDLFYILATEAMRPAQDLRRVRSGLKRHEQSFAEHLSAITVSDTKNQRYVQRFLVDDPRVTAKNYGSSLAYHALIAAGIIEDARTILPLQAQSEGWDFGGRLKKLFAHGQEGDITHDDEQSLEQLIDEMFQWTLQHANIVCATIERVAAPDIYNTLRPSMIGADDMGKAHAAETRALRANFPCSQRHVWVGDPYQSRPLTSSIPLYNGFVSQLGLSEFTRLLLSGFPCVALSKQHRSCESITSFISQIFYNGEMQHGLPREDINIMQSFAKFMAAAGLEAGNIMLLDIDGAPEVYISGSKSKTNPVSAAVCWFIVQKLVQQFGIESQSITLMTPYRAQKVVHDSIRAQLDARDGSTSPEDDLLLRQSPKDSLRGVKIETIDKLPGMESDIVILDITSASKEVGFIGDAERLNTALSRAKHGIIIVADTKAFGYHERYGSSKSLDEVIFTVRQRGGRVPVSGKSLDKIKSDYLPLLPKTE